MAQYASAMPNKPLRPNTIFPGTVSVPEGEGSGMGFPAGSTAEPETLPSTGEAEKHSTSTPAAFHPGSPIKRTVEKIDWHLSNY